MAENDLNSQIESIFSSRPRNGDEKDAFWHKRARLEERLSQIILARSQNVCIDGPTGSGKTSLALTVLSRTKSKVIWAPVVNEMSWPDFCEEIFKKAWRINSIMSKEKSRDIGVRFDSKKDVSISDLISPLRFLDRIKFSLGEKGADEASLREASRKWSISDVEYFLSDNDITLLVDDFEKATKDLVTKIADLCKNLTFSGGNKAVIIGTGSTFERLYNSDEGLDGRLAELSVASFGSRREVWQYMNDGFERLNFKTPRMQLRLKRISKDDADKIEESVYEAADGMPKYINELALRICQRLLDKQNKAEDGPIYINAGIITSECSKMLAENVSRCNKKFRDAEKHLKSSVEFRLVLKAIFDMGANSVHSVESLIKHVQRMDENFSEEQFESGIQTLKNLGLYVQTGKSGEVVFAKDPMFSHVLGLVCNDPIKFNKDEKSFGLFGQRALPLFFK